MIVILSTSDPIVSATLASPCDRLTAARPALHDRRWRHRLAKNLVDALDQVVALLIQLVHAALRRRDLMIVLHAGFVFLVPQLDVRGGEAGDEVAEGVCHSAQI